MTKEAICIWIDGDDWQWEAGWSKVQPLIRCKDCKHYYEKEWVVGGGSYTTCWYQTIANAQPNDFCSRAERKEE